MPSRHDQPFRTHTINASFQILDGFSPDKVPGSKLHVYPYPVEVSYCTVRSLIPRLFAAHPSIDFVIHLGVANLSPGTFLLETRAHRDGYEAKDVKGVCGRELEDRFEKGWEDWSTRPDCLHSSLDAEKLAKDLNRSAVRFYLPTPPDFWYISLIILYVVLPQTNK